MGPWWVTQRIDATVTRQFVERHLVPAEIARLDQPVAFSAEDLTERTYWESIQASAKRMFLILVDIGAPDQIFPIVDDGWDDAELPLTLENVDRLQLTPVKDDRVDRKFYQRQFQYLVKTIDKGTHRDFVDGDLVPLDVVDKGPPLNPKGHHADKVKLPNAPGKIFTRRKYHLSQGSGGISAQEFLDMVNAVRYIQNDHMVSYWGSYTHHSCGYILFTPIADSSLKGFLSNTPSSFKSMPKKNRRELVMNWILCLVDTLCFLHSRNRAHCYIKPSALFLTNQYHIFFLDPTRLSVDSSSQADKSSFDREWYDYAAPEQWFRPAGPGSPPTRKAVLASLSASAERNSQLPASGLDMATTQVMASAQQSDVFSLGCIILELLSYLLKRSGSKFAAFRSAKHKQAGRGGAVLDTSFHKNLGQVEAWMSALAKDAAKKVSDVDGAHVFRGFTPILHVVAEMLAASPFERPPATEVQQRIYRVLRENCGIEKLHCENQYSVDLQYDLGRLSLHDSLRYSQPIPIQTPHQYFGTQTGFESPESPPPLLHRRTNSSSGFSQRSQTSSNTTASSERDSYTPARGMPAPQPIRAPHGWSRSPAYISPPNSHPSLFADGP
jgi:serine/threonine protein kinase